MMRTFVLWLEFSPLSKPCSIHVCVIHLHTLHPACPHIFSPMPLNT